MKLITNVGRKRLEFILSQPGLFKIIVIVLSLFLLAIVLYGIIVGSLITVKLFPGIKF